MQNAERSGVKKRLNIGIQEDLKYQLFFLPDNIINSFVYTFSFNLHSYCWIVIMTGLGD